MLADLPVRRQNTCDSWQIWLTEPLAHLIDEITVNGLAMLHQEALCDEIELNIALPSHACFVSRQANVRLGHPNL
jgi:hypothetical protein